MKIKINWKYCILILVDILLFTYLVFAITSWNKPDEALKVCTKVEINIEDENENGFLKTAEVKQLLEKKSLYPLSQKITEINTRDIEAVLLKTAFVKTAQCYLTNEGHIYISITQRTPLIRVKSDNGEDYYLDDNGGVMPNSQYTSDMIIVTGNVKQFYACRYISLLASVIMDDEFWKNQVEQINVLIDGGIEIIPRVGDHIINIGQLPKSNQPEKRKELVTEFVKKQLHRMELFYQYGLSQAGWNKYSYISLEYENQVICTHREKEKKKEYIPVIVQTPQTITMTDVAESTDKKDEEAKKKQAEEASKKTDDKVKPTSESKPKQSESKPKPADNSSKVKDNKPKTSTSSTKPSTEKKKK